LDGDCLADEPIFPESYKHGEKTKAHNINRFLAAHQRLTVMRFQFSQNLKVAFTFFIFGKTFKLSVPTVEA
jgi:hypothetical protein